jgi:hypothetical protein
MHWHPAGFRLVLLISLVLAFAGGLFLALLALAGGLADPAAADQVPFNCTI